MWPIVPTFTCGFERSNFSFAIALRLRLVSTHVYVCIALLTLAGRARSSGADDRDRTGDLVLTKDALCQLSYIGESVISRQSSVVSGAGDGDRTRDQQLGRL